MAYVVSDVAVICHMHGARRYLYLPNGVMNVVKIWLSLSRGH